MHSEEQEKADKRSLSVCVLASGSRGNAIYISDGVTSILIDAGLSAREIDRRLHSRGLDGARLNAIVVTHEHTDHIRGVERLARRYRLPVYLSTRIHPAVTGLERLPDVCAFACGGEFRIDSLTVRPFSVSHDARDPAGFTIGCNGIRIGIATDLGMATALVRDHLQGCRLLIIEANHDPDMLTAGPYPWFLKQRIRGRSGHLSNAESSRLLAEVVHSGLEHVILAHLSEINNTPERAATEASQVLAGSGTRLTIAAQSRCSPLLCLE